jgi:hypothetical protein
MGELGAALARQVPALMVLGIALGWVVHRFLAHMKDITEGFAKAVKDAADKNAEADSKIADALNKNAEAVSALSSRCHAINEPPRSSHG